MSFTYDILTEEEAEKERRFKLLEAGVYPFTVINATAKASKSGNPMIELLLSIYDNEGKEHHIYDYLVGTKNMAWKLRHFCDSTKLVDQYETGSFDEFICIKKSGFALISIKPEHQDRNGKIYKEKNNVDDYVLDQQGAINHIKTEKKAVTMDDDDLPF